MLLCACEHFWADDGLFSSALILVPSIETLQAPCDGLVLGTLGSGEILKPRGVANPFSLWQTLGMTNQPAQTQSQRVPIRREDRKAQKLMAEIETKLALQAKAALKPDSPSRN